MKRYGAWFASTVFAMFLMAGTVFGQEPPGCCKEALPMPEDGDAAVSVVRVTRNLLSEQRLTRGEFIDRLAATLFAGRQPDLVLSTTRTVSRADRAETGSLAVRETRYVRIARNEIRSEELEVFDDVYLTDGTSYVRVSFAADDSRAAQ